jgi:hypothetical protein
VKYAAATLGQHWRLAITWNMAGDAVVKALQTWSKKNCAGW